MLAHGIHLESSYLHLGRVVGEASPMHGAPQQTVVHGPFYNYFRGCAWNCRSLWGNLSSDSFNFAETLMDTLDFAVFLETRENPSRKLTLENHFLGCKVFSSGISQHRGGIAVVIKQSFLQRFCRQNWQVIVAGRVGALHLDGSEGALTIIAVYCDPSSKAQQALQCEAIAKSIDPKRHCLIAGDFNFVTTDHDRISKANGSPTGNNDKAMADKWRQIVGGTVQEWQQDCMTCESSFAYSRIDRVYSNIDAASSLCFDTFCQLVEHPRHLSDHSPLIFGIRSRKKSTEKPIPCWVIKHPWFDEEFSDALDFYLKSAGDSAFGRMTAVKHAAKDAAKCVMRACRGHVAYSVQEKLSCCITFVRALFDGNYTLANKLKSRCDTLKHAHVGPGFQSTDSFASIKAAIVDFSQTSIRERIIELKALKGKLPDYCYERRKESISDMLRKLAPGTSAGIHAIYDRTSGKVITDEQGLAEHLNNHWGQVFEQKPTDAALRARWCAELQGALNISINDLRPTKDDVNAVLESLPHSAPGPDGLPFELYGVQNPKIAEIIYDVVLSMFDGSETPYDCFNNAFLVCLPKAAMKTVPGVGDVFEPSSTRPLSIVDAINRIIASVLRISLERVVGPWISKYQQGFVLGRQLLRNVVDVDFAAQKISLKFPRGAIILLDFRAAFPSIAHEYIWDALTAVGIPSQFISCLKLFYRNNRHHIKVGKGIFPSFVCNSGVRQGCPLSGILFALCADLLLRKVAAALTGDGIVRGYADDTALVVEDYIKDLPYLSLLFEDFRRISGLELNVKKTVFIPLWQYSTSEQVRKLVREYCPLWSDFIISGVGRYLGFMVGPKAGTSSWSHVLAKFDKRVAEWSSKRLGMLLSIFAYKVYIHSLLGFVGQLCEAPPDLLQHFSAALRRLASGPGNWVTDKDLSNLTKFGFAAEFPNPIWMLMSAKLRVTTFVIKDAKSLHKELVDLQLEYPQRPFGNWHTNSFATVLYRNQCRLHDAQITPRAVFSQLPSLTEKCHFQQKATEMVRNALADPYDAENRIRNRMQRWKLTDPPGHIARRAIKVLHSLSKRAPPRLVAHAFRTLMNGWITDERMRGILASAPRGCALGCRGATDRIEHYAYCPIFWKYASARRPAGLGLPDSSRTLAHFLLVAKGVGEADIVRMAAGSYALARVHCHLGERQPEADAMQLLRWYTHRALEGSPAAKALNSS